MNYSVYIKSGTCGWFDYDGCDQIIKKVIGAVVLPNKGDVLEMSEEKRLVRYMVTEVKHSLMDHCVYYSIYVIKI